MERISRLTPAARALLAYSPLSYMLDAVCENPSLAEAWVDDAARPARCALLLGRYLFLSRGADEPFLAAFKGLALPPERRGELIVFYEGAAAAEAAAKALGGAFRRVRSLYRYDPARPLPPGAGRAARITEELLASGLDNLEMLDRRARGAGTYRDMADFLRRGVGYACVEGGGVRALCASEYPSAAAVGVVVEVEEAWRGLAKEMTAALAAEAAGRGLAVYWQCWANSAPAVSVALACGFVKQADYPALLVSDA